ncbi:MAG: DUF1624 domain-containing protein, partial [Bacteroidetes bacterium]|nr:DUF1624 domain-containing protein [Bacteroidota bacterium]
DFTRGLVMIIMALDHVRDLIHVDAVTQSPTNLATTTPLLFFTRWITYLCAPIFVFLAGTSAYISFKRKNDFKQSRNFLLKRGLWLVLLEFTVVNFVMFFDTGFHTYIFEVIAAIGFGFIILSLLLRISPQNIALTGLLIICCHNLLPLIPFSEGSVIKTILTPFFAPGLIPISAHTNLIMGYPPIPWLGIMLIGFASGRLFELPVQQRKKLFIRIGTVALLAFIIIRFINIYGDSVPWSSQKNAVFTFLSFMNVTKYPPSLVFDLVTLGIMFFILFIGEIVSGRLAAIVTVYGKVPLAYFIVHFFLIHITMVIVMLLQGFHWNQLDFVSGSFGRPKGVESGLPLWAIYILWIGIVAVLYLPCKWYANYKMNNRAWWLKYL